MRLMDMLRDNTFSQWRISVARKTLLELQKEEKREDRCREIEERSRGGMVVLKLGPLHSSITESLEKDNGLEGVIKRGRKGRKREDESRKMMITLASQHYGTAETEIMIEEKTQRTQAREWGVLNVNKTHIEKTQQ